MDIAGVKLDKLTAQTAVEMHLLSENKEARRAFLSIAAQFGANVLGAVAAGLTVAGPDINAALQLQMPPWAFTVVSPLVATGLAALSATINAYSKKMAQEGVKVALSTPQPEALKTFYNSRP